MLLEWHIIWVKVKYVVSCLGWLMSLTWCMYECEYEMSWLRMLNPLTLVCMNVIPLLMLTGSFMWNLKPRGKVMNVEVESRNGILQVNEW